MHQELQVGGTSGIGTTFLKCVTIWGAGLNKF